MALENNSKEVTQNKSLWNKWFYHFILVIILVMGGYLRLVGTDWDEEQHLHPDERFLTMVESGIQPTYTDRESLGPPPTALTQQWRSSYLDVLPDCQVWGDYFDTSCSPLNPNNRGYDYYVYGTLPIFIVRYAGELLSQTGYGEIYIIGRILSAFFDILVIVLVYAIANKIYDRRIGLLGAAFYAFSVLLIQQSHFFTVDTYSNFFIVLALYFAVSTAVSRIPPAEDRLIDDPDLGVHMSSVGLVRRKIASFTSHHLFWFSILFGASLGMAVASKINAAPLAITLPGAAVIFLLRLSPKDRENQSWKVFTYLVIAAITSLLAFRVFQPYAFTGPGFFNILPNKAWIDDLNALNGQMGGDVDFPPALQWARRPIWFSFQNIVLWGLGLPLGITAWLGFFWMGWKILKGDWRKHVLLWGWTTFYFVWQSFQWNSTMRYQLPIYPLLAIFGAWLIIKLWDNSAYSKGIWLPIRRVLVLVFGVIVLGLTFVWAFSFSSIYTRPHTRVEASRWLIQNMPGPVNLSIQTEDGIYTQPLPYPQDITIQSGSPYQMNFTALAGGTLLDIFSPHAVDKELTNNQSVVVSISSITSDSIMTSETISPEEIQSGRGSVYSYNLSEPVSVHQGESFSLVLSLIDGFGDLEICGPMDIGIHSIEGPIQFQLSSLSECILGSNLPIQFEFTSDTDGVINSISMMIKPSQPTADPPDKRLVVEISGAGGNLLGIGELLSKFDQAADPRGESFKLAFNNKINLEKGENYTLKYSLSSDVGAISFSGAAAANESSWDDGLPLRMDGYDPYGGIYTGGLNFEMYWDDNEEKFNRFVTTLEQADFILITSSRQWGSTTRVPERYPLTFEYYKHLLGCPSDQTLEWCYNIAQPGDFQGSLGYDLIEVFQSNPSVGEFEINDQFAEEAFTVYDHPKVFILKKNDSFKSAQVRNILGSVDLTKVIRVTPKQADSQPGNLLLPPDRLEEQRAGGTWSDIFNPDALHNRFQVIGVVLWYVSVGLLGLIVYPLVRYAMPGLADKGYPFARITGLLLLSVIVWLATSARIPFSRSTIGVVLLFLAILGGYLAYHQREEFKLDFWEKRGHFLMIEGLFLVFFVIGLLIRFGNPDLWHPWKGGEKPMDFSYFNAVLKSTSFPPYDPWFAGGYINYYYYGFMLVGVLVKFLGIVPSFAYNLILPTLLSMIALGAFSVVWNLLSGYHKTKATEHEIIESNGGRSDILKKLRIKQPLLFTAGISGAVLMAFLGNLGILQMFSQGFQKTVVTVSQIESAGFISKVIWTISGFFKTLTGTPIPLRMDEWYWNPSRVISYQHGNPITEFPFFTFLYGDLHAHLIALPVALLAISWVISIVQSRAWEVKGRRNWQQIGFSLIIGGMAIGALYPINLSDIYTYLPLAAVALIYAVWRYFDVNSLPFFMGNISKVTKLLVVILLGIGGLYLVSQVSFLPYSTWYNQGYDEVRIWDGTHTPISQYLTHWGFFLFIIVSWMFHETIDWMASTPASQLNRLKPYRNLILGVAGSLAILILILGINLYPEGLPTDTFPAGLGVHVAWLVLPLAAWAGVLILRQGISDAKRMVLFFIGTGFILTLMVEIIVVSGDIGRMNTVFKFYLHTWTLFSISCGAILGWIFMTIKGWSLQNRTIWQLIFGFLLLSVSLYPLLGSIAKIGDRMESTAPHTLDGLTFMRYATYHDEGVAMDLSQDYNAIRWMQDNITGSPVIVEANSVEYHWGTRYTIYTGLPGVVGWNWHQRQQRTITPHDWVFERVDAVHNFYQTADIQWTQDFIQKYDVSYIVFGQLEQAKYPGPGLDKFAAQEGRLWNEVFRVRDTVIYEVINNNITSNLDL